MNLAVTVTTIIGTNIDDILSERNRWQDALVRYSPIKKGRALASPSFWQLCYHSSLTPSIIWRLPPVNCLSFKNRFEVTFA